MSKPGRNDPCPCGSGRKYKRCCLGREADHDAFATQLEAKVLPTLAELARFAQAGAGGPLEALAGRAFAFWTGPLDEERSSRLVEHLMFDARLERYGRTAIEQFVLERGPRLGEPQRALVERWRETRRRLYRVDGWEAGFLRCSDALPEQANAISVWALGQGAGLVADGAPVALRALPALDSFVAIGKPTTFHDRSLEDVRDAIKARHLNYVRSTRIVSFDDYLRLAPTALDEEAACGGVRQSIIVPGTRV